MPSAAVSSSTVSLVKDMLKDSKMSTRVQQKLLKQLEETGKLPQLVIKEAKPPSIKKKSPVVKVPSRPQLRTKDMITIEDVDQYLPRPMKDLSQEKEKYINWLEFDEKNPPVLKKVPPPENENDLDEFKMLIDEIKERRDWLKEMEELGQADSYRKQVDIEIKLRIKRLHELEKKRPPVDF